MKLYKVKEVASMFSVSRSTVLRLIKNGDLAAIKIPSKNKTAKKLLLVSEDAISDFLKEKSK